MGSTGMTAISMFDYSAQWSSHQSYKILDLETISHEITHILMQNTKCSKESQYVAISSLHKICMQTSQPLLTDNTFIKALLGAKEARETTSSTLMVQVACCHPPWWYRWHVALKCQNISNSLYSITLLKTVISEHNDQLPVISITETKVPGTVNHHIQKFLECMSP